MRKSASIALPTRHFPLSIEATTPSSSFSQDKRASVESLCHTIMRSSSFSVNCGELRLHTPCCFQVSGRISVGKISMNARADFVHLLPIPCHLRASGRINAWKMSTPVLAYHLPPLYSPSQSPVHRRFLQRVSIFLLHHRKRKAIR